MVQSVSFCSQFTYRWPPVVSHLFDGDIAHSRRNLFNHIMMQLVHSCTWLLLECELQSEPEPWPQPQL